MITPTVGRTVWFYPKSDDEHFSPGSPIPAEITRVRDYDSVDVRAFNSNGYAERESVVFFVSTDLLLTEAEVQSIRPSAGGRACVSAF